MTSCPYCGSNERPQIYPDGTLRCPTCGQLADKPLKRIVEDDSCPACGSPMERGYIVGAYGVYWNDHIPALICSGERLSDKGRFWALMCPSVKAFRCRKCRIIRY